MKDRTAGRLAWLMFGIIAALFVAGFVLSYLNRADGGTLVSSSIETNLVEAASFLFPLVGILVASRQPRNTMAWILLAIGLVWGLVAFLDNYAYYGLVANPGSVPKADVAAAFGGNVLWVPAIGLPGTFLILLFPDGRLPSRRWKPLAWLSAAALTLSFLVLVFTPALVVTIGGNVVEGLPPIPNPLWIEALRPILEPMLFVIVLIPICIVGCAVSLVVRFRSSRGVERLQLKWLVAAAGVVAVSYLTTFILGSLSGGLDGSTDVPLWLEVLDRVMVFSFTLIPVAAGIAILKYRLYDIDLVISKTVVFAGLAGFITAMYVAIVVGVGSLLGAGDAPNLGLSIVATAVVAVAFQPVRERLTRAANRLVYGRRATPYEVLSRFSAQVGETVATEQTLVHMARLLAEGTGAARAQVWLKVDERMRSAASWPQEAVPELAAVVNSDGSLPEFAEEDLAVPVSHDGQLLGALTVTKKRGEPVTPTEHSLVEDVAGQAGLVVRNVGLTADLRARLEELRDSRRRLVEAQDQERRRLERDLHDGAQQQLVALKIKLGVAKRLAERDGATQAAGLVNQLGQETDEAVAALRELAHGIYPPLLAAEGLEGALRARAAKAPIPVTVEADGVGRLSQEVEAAVYFCVLEAIQNAIKYAQAPYITVHLAHTDGELTFEVSDDGAGFDPTITPQGHGLRNMTDRLHALEGTLDIHTTPGEGTRVVGRVPASTPAVIA